ncbi:hypothetical protein E0500_027615 [Streptomyces sp. KM273126]|uniref:hypothetical protein n=1 Tax=Streptomyces sp. KM273126 TaxID=2545247 RepID=UPI00103EECCF|nr:hypothetical protein [Streptomyces sp. KM273126]MBA2811067.1 hypothetical protein [Streptomyces sp. KM273126]
MRAARCPPGRRWRWSRHPSDTPDLEVTRSYAGAGLTSPVDAGPRLAGHPERWWRELARVLTDEGRAVALLPEARGLGQALALGLAPVHVQQLSLFGSRPLLVRLERPRTRRRSPGRREAEAG